MKMKETQKNKTEYQKFTFKRNAMIHDTKLELLKLKMNQPQHNRFKNKFNLHLYLYAHNDLSINNNRPDLLVNIVSFFTKYSINW